MSLKGGIPETELNNLFVDAKKGKKEAINKLSEYAQNGSIGAQEYKKLLIVHEINKYKKNKEIKRNIKGLLALIVLLSSLVFSIAYLIEPYGKSGAFWFILLWLWALDCAIDKDSKSKKNSKLEIQNELLKEKIEAYESHQDSQTL